MTSERVNARTYAHTSVHSYAHVRPLVRHASVHSYAYTYAGSYARPSPRSSALVTRRMLSKITTFYESLQKNNIYIYNIANRQNDLTCHLTTVFFLSQVGNWNWSKRADQFLLGKERCTFVSSIYTQIITNRLMDEWQRGKEIRLEHIPDPNPRRKNIPEHVGFDCSPF